MFILYLLPKKLTILLQLNSGDRSLLHAFKDIGRMAERMGLPQIIRVRICVVIYALILTF